MSELKALLQQFLSPPVVIPKLSKITDWDDLVEMWDDSEKIPAKRRVIEHRMIEVLSAINDLDTLIDMWMGETDDDTPMRLIECRIAEVVATVNDWGVLDRFHGTTTRFNSVPDDLIEQRLTEMVRTITINEIPSWFTKYLQSPDNMPPYLLSSVLAKARELTSLI